MRSRDYAQSLPQLLSEMVEQQFAGVNLTAEQSEATIEKGQADEQ